MNIWRILLALAALATYAALFAPETLSSQETRLASAVPAVETEIPALKSEGTATLLSVAGTALPLTLGLILANAGDGEGGSGLGLALFSYGMYFGPATGYWYAGASGAAWKGIGVRLGVSLVGASLMTLACAAGCELGIFDSNPDDGGLVIASLVAVATVGVVAYSLVRDIAGVDGRVRRRNAEVAARRSESRLSVLPVVTPRDGGTLGIVATMRF